MLGTDTLAGEVTHISSNGVWIRTLSGGSYAFNHPTGVGFDGTRIWVTASSSNTVSVFTASTGALVGTYATGTGPRGITFDGTNMWVANEAGGSITKIQVR